MYPFAASSEVLLLLVTACLAAPGVVWAVAESRRTQRSTLLWGCLSAFGAAAAFVLVRRVAASEADPTVAGLVGLPLLSAALVGLAPALAVNRLGTVAPGQTFRVLVLPDRDEPGASEWEAVLSLRRRTVCLAGLGRRGEVMGPTNAVDVVVDMEVVRISWQPSPVSGAAPTAARRRVALLPLVDQEAEPHRARIAAALGERLRRRLGPSSPRAAGMT